MAAGISGVTTILAKNAQFVEIERHEMSHEKVIFVYLGRKLPKYANASLESAKQSSGLDILVLGNRILKDQIRDSTIEFISVEDFYTSAKVMEIRSKINLPLDFRQGFWFKTLERLFVLHQYMDVYKIKRVFHAELDQILFRCDKLVNSLDNYQFEGLALPFHSLDRGVASILYCNDVKSLESLIDFTREVPSFNNEMELIAQWALRNPHRIKLLPTVASEVKSNDIFHRSGLEIIPSTTINGVVDALQMGQWIGGEDPRNVSIRNSPKNKHVYSQSEELLSIPELANLEFTLTLDGSLMVTYDKSNVYNVYNIHLHSKIHPWIIKSHDNLHKLLNDSNKSEAVTFPTTRWIQISDFIATGFNSVSCHPIKFLKRFLFIAVVYLQFTNLLRKSESKMLGLFFMRVSLSLAKILKLQKLQYSLRQVISLAQPSDPLRDKILPTIDIAIPCHVKDFDNLPLVIQGAKSSVRNPIGKIKLITPEYLSAELQTKFPDCIVSTDESILSADLVKAINELVPKERTGWIIQQIIKFRMAITSDQVATLIVDADTILLTPKIWLNSQGTQILCIAEEYHPPYKKHLRKVFGGQTHLLSFVTHHQLMQRDSVREIFGQNGEGLIEWLNLADFNESSSICEYETYGEWMLKHKPNQIVFSKWNNVPAIIKSGDTTYADISDNYSKYGSVSNHSYL
jgi:hypothetical protein